MVCLRHWGGADHAMPPAAPTSFTDMACNDPTRRTMRSFILAWLPVLLALWLAGTPALARDRCAASRLSPADQAFCAGQRLKDVDEAMGRALQLAVNTVADPQALRRQQAK